MKFCACNDLTVSHLTSVDSAQMHFLFLSCERVGVNNVTVQAPETSPNTDGMHIQASKHVRIEDSGIGTGNETLYHRSLELPSILSCLMVLFACMIS